MISSKIYSSVYIIYYIRIGLNILWLKFIKENLLRLILDIVIILINYY